MGEFVVCDWRLESGECTCFNGGSQTRTHSLTHTVLMVFFVYAAMLLLCRTLVSHAGTVKHIGQLFFDEAWNDKVLGTEAYLANKGHRTLNADDHDFQRASIDGSSAVIQYVAYIYLLLPFFLFSARGLTLTFLVLLTTLKDRASWRKDRRWPDRVYKYVFFGVCASAVDCG